MIMAGKFWYCHACGKAVDTVLVDGYQFGDRLLEEVIFVIKNVGGIPTCEGVTDECKDYFSELNEKAWLDACRSFCDADIDIGSCPICGDDVHVLAPHPRPPVKPHSLGEMDDARSAVYARYSKTHLKLIEHLDTEAMIDLAARIRANEGIDIDVYLAPLVPILLKRAEESAKIRAMQDAAVKREREREMREIAKHERERKKWELK
jgi:hypothetical protein